MDNAKKAALLRQCIDMLHDVDALQQQALGACDVCEYNHNTLQAIIDDFVCDIIDLEARAEGVVP